MTAAALLNLPELDDYTALIPIGFYGRISRDPRETKAGVNRQQYESEKYVEPRNARIVDHRYIDNDLSGYKRNVVRPEFDKLLADLRAGFIRGVVLYDMDRLTRQPIQLEYLIKIYEEHPDYVFYTVHGDVDLTTKQGRFVARMLVTMANDASAATSERLKSMHADYARKGIPVMPRRMFGWMASYDARLTLAQAIESGDEDRIYVAQRRVNDEQRRAADNDEATLIRKASADIRNGVKRGAVVRQWNTDGITTSTGKPWSNNSITSLLTNPRLAGIRTLRGHIVRNDDNTPVIGQWEPILPIAEWEALQAVLTDSARSGISTGRANYLGSGVFRCAKCGHSLSGRAYGPVRPDGTRARNYQCGKSSGGCGSVGCAGAPAEAFLNDAVLDRLRGMNVPTTINPVVWSGEEDLTARSVTRAQLMERIKDGKIDADWGWSQLEEFDQEIRRMTADRTAWLRAHPVRKIESPATVLQRWPDMDDDQRRAVVQRLITCVVVAPSGRTGCRFDPSRLTVVWRDED